MKTPSQKGKMSRNKGFNFEREIAKRFRGLGFVDARRQLEYHEDDCNGVDLQGTGRFKVQCKRLKNYAPINRIEEIQNVKGDDIKLLVTKADNKPIMVVMEFSDFEKIMNDIGEAYDITH